VIKSGHCMHLPEQEIVGSSASHYCRVVVYNIDRYYYCMWRKIDGFKGQLFNGTKPNEWIIVLEKIFHPTHASIKWSLNEKRSVLFMKRKK
jgi:hypothetical protein